MEFVWSGENVHMDGELYDENRKTYRYCLLGKGKNPLIVLGLNPSTADNKNPDPTMRRVIGFMESNGFDGFLMINLYPLRTPSPKILKEKGFDEKIHKLNLHKIESYLSKIENPSILLAFGSKIQEIKFLKKCLSEIVDVCKKYNPKWKCLKTTKEGHTCHPLYLKSDLKLKPFDVAFYIEKLDD